MVSADDVIITNIMDTSEGLEVNFYVRESGGILPATALASAIQVSRAVATYIVIATKQLLYTKYKCHPKTFQFYMVYGTFNDNK